MKGAVDVFSMGVDAIVTPAVEYFKEKGSPILQRGAVVAKTGLIWAGGAALAVGGLLLALKIYTTRGLVTGMNPLVPLRRFILTFKR